jgi:chromosome segregation ATPase
VKDLEGRLAAATKEHEGKVASMRSGHDEKLASTVKEHEGKLAALVATHDETIGEHKGEIADLQTALSTTRDKIKSGEAEAKTLGEKLAAAGEAQAQKDGKLAELRKDVDELERQSASLQEQVLRAHARIKSDEAVVLKAKKAVAVALTLLDGEPPQQQVANGAGR